MIADLQTFVYRFLYLPGSILCACFLLVISSAAKSQPSHFEALSTDGEPGYRFAVPEGWERKTDLPRPMIAFVAPEERDYRANFSVNVFPKNVKPSEQKAFLQSVLSEYTKQKATVSPQIKTTLGGSPAWQWSAKLSVRNFPTVENRQVVCFRNNRAYILTFTYLPELRGKYTPICDRLLASFRFSSLPAKDKRGHLLKSEGKETP